MPHVAIIGAGISGLATAFNLQQAGPDWEITVLEAANRPGGTIWTERRDGFQVELGANGFLDNKPSTLTLCGRVGLEGKLISASDAARHRFLFFNNSLVALPEGLWSFLRSPLLSWRGKLHLWRERFHPAGDSDADESVHEFVARRAGKEAAEIFADALVTGIFAGDAHLLSMKACFPRIVEMERQHGSLFRAMSHAAKQRRAQARLEGKPCHRGSRLLSFREGLRLLIETLRSRLKKASILGARVQRIWGSPDQKTGWKIQAENRQELFADAVILACPAYHQASIVEAFDSVLARLMATIAYAPAVVVALGYRRNDVPSKLNGFGYIAPQKLRRDILGVQWCSSVFPDRALNGMVLLRAMAGGWHRRDILAWDDDRLLHAVRNELKLAMRIESAPVFHHIARWERAIPQYHMGHLERVAEIEKQAAAHAGLFLTGNAYHGVALNDCTEQAEAVAARVAACLTAR